MRGALHLNAQTSPASKKKAQVIPKEFRSFYRTGQADVPGDTAQSTEFGSS